MAKRKRWAMAFVVLSLCIMGYKQLEVALASQKDSQITLDVIDSKNNKNIENIALNNKSESITLESFINDVIEEQKEKNVSTNSSYSLLTRDSLLTKDEFINSKSVALDPATKIKKLEKMQKLASYIASTYDVPLLKAENIVYSSFVEATKKDLEPTLVLSLISVESTFKQYSKSSAGAVGLTQVMPKIHHARISEEKVDIWSVHGNIKVGTDILKEYLELADGNMKKALQMYNGSRKDTTFKYSNKVMNKMQNFMIASK